MNRRFTLLLMLLSCCATLRAQTISLSAPSQFDTVLVNTTDSLAFWVRNTGPTAFTVTDINTTRFQFWIKDSSFTVPSNDSTRVFVFFRTNQNVTWKDVLLLTGTGLRGALPLRWTGTGRYSEASYNPTQGLWENSLKTALTNLVTGHTQLGYNTARDRMFETINDFDLNDSIECVYIGRRIHAATRTEAQSQNFNTEHTWPQSFFSSNEPMVSDLNHLFPTDAAPNSARANYPFGPVVSNITYNVGGSKLGHRADGATAFEPRDVHKGDVARGLFYFTIRYGNLGSYMDATQESNLRVWNVSDPVSAKETLRNNSVAFYQGKRNPMIDHPEFADRITYFRTSTAPTLYPDVALSTASINFGSIAPGDSVEWTVIILNNGRASLSISSLALQSATSNFRIVNVPTSVTIDSFATVLVRFTPTQANQSFSNAIVIQSNDPDEATVNISLGGSTTSGGAQTALNTPANSATGVETPVIFSWYRTQGADRYHLQVALTGTFSSSVIDDSTIVDSSASGAGLALNTTYYWRVRAHTGTGWGSYSSTRNFTTWTTPSQVQLTAPSNGSTGVSIPTLFTWQSAPTAVNYQFDLSTSPIFGSFIVSDSSLTGTSHSVPGLPMNTTHYWRARAKNGAGWGAYSSTRSFTTWTTPGQAQPISPADSALSVPMPTQFLWQTTPLATRYHFELSTSPSFASVLLSDSSLTDTTKTVSGLDPGTAYYWRIRGGNGAGWGVASSTRTFTTWIVPAQVQLESPADSARGTSAPVQLIWLHDPIATTYNVEISTSPSFTTLTFSDSVLIDTTVSVPGLDTLTMYHWRVRARNNAGWGEFSTGWQFRIAVALTISAQMNSGWNLISLPVVLEDQQTTILFPSAISAAYAYENGYTQRDTLIVGEGYWLRFGASETVSLSGEPVLTDSVEVVAGWNLVGAISAELPATSVTSVPAGIIVSQFYGFGNGYITSDILSPMKGYWVRCSQTGRLILGN